MPEFPRTALRTAGEGAERSEAGEGVADTILAYSVHSAGLRLDLLQ